MSPRYPKDRRKDYYLLSLEAVLHVKTNGLTAAILNLKGAVDLLFDFAEKDTFILNKKLVIFYSIEIRPIT